MPSINFNGGGQLTYGNQAFTFTGPNGVAQGAKGQGASAVTNTRTVNVGHPSGNAYVDGPNGTYTKTPEEISIQLANGQGLVLDRTV